MPSKLPRKALSLGINEGKFPTLGNVLKFGILGRFEKGQKTTLGSMSEVVMMVVACRGRSVSVQKTILRNYSRDRKCRLPGGSPQEGYLS